MSNIYPKTESILEAVRSLLVGDNSNTGHNVREIHHYCEDRIFREMNKVRELMPQITLRVETDVEDLTIPTGEYTLIINTHVYMDDEYPQTKRDRIDQRIATLINRKSESLNLATSKNLRCRLVQKTSSITSEDGMAHVFSRETTYFLQCDDENVD